MGRGEHRAGTKKQCVRYARRAVLVLAGQWKITCFPRPPLPSPLGSSRTHWSVQTVGVGMEASRVAWRPLEI